MIRWEIHKRCRLVFSVICTVTQKSPCFQSHTFCLLTGRAGSFLSCEKGWWGPSVTQMVWVIPGMETQRRLLPLLDPHPSHPASSSAWMTISTQASPGLCQSVNLTHPYWLTSKGIKASPPGWWRSTPCPRKRFCSTLSSGGWGWISQWIHPCLWAPGPGWWAGFTRTSLGYWHAWSPSILTPWGGPMPTMPRFSCGGREEGLHLSSYHPSKTVKHLIGHLLCHIRVGHFCSETANTIIRWKDVKKH